MDIHRYTRMRSSNYHHVYIAYDSTKKEGKKEILSPTGVLWGPYSCLLSTNDPGLIFPHLRAPQKTQNRPGVSIIRQ